MKNFKKEIQVTVSVDSIANLMLKNMNPEFKHSEMVVSTTIGRMLSHDEKGLSRLYNALNGYDNKINFRVNEVVKLKDVRAYGYWTEESIERNNSVHQSIEEGTIVEINEYSDRPILVEFDVPQKDRTKKKIREWVYMSQATEIPTED